MEMSVIGIHRHWIWSAVIITLEDFRNHLRIRNNFLEIDDCAITSFLLCDAEQRGALETVRVNSLHIRISLTEEASEHELVANPFERSLGLAANLQTVNIEIRDTRNLSVTFGFDGVSSNLTSSSVGETRAPYLADHFITHESFEIIALMVAGAKPLPYI